MWHDHVIPAAVVAGISIGVAGRTIVMRFGCCGSLVAAGIAVVGLCWEDGAPLPIHVVYGDGEGDVSSGGARHSPTRHYSHKTH